MEKTITIDITPAGSTKIEANGFEGCGCTEATEHIELVLGGGQKKTTPKPEMYAAPMSTAQGIKRTF
jgi:hypothetical protein